MDIAPLLEPFEYTLGGGGKNIRGLIVRYVQTLVRNEHHALTPAIIEDINIAHNISLIVDDIEDGSEKRRGQPCAHVVYGVPLSLNSAYLKAFQMLGSIEDRYPPELADDIRKICIKCVEKAHIGQGLDIYWARTKYVPTLEEYLFMVDHKTGYSFEEGSKLCLETLKTVDIDITEEKRDRILRMLSSLGRFFQIRDDYINLTCPRYWRLKGFCEDFDERKVSYVFTVLKKLDEQDTLYEQLCSAGRLTNADKVMFYTRLYNKNVLQQVCFDLGVYVKNIRAMEKQITGHEVCSEPLESFFLKLQYGSPLEPGELGSVLAMMSAGA